jgi:cytochrome c oxidase subunit 4
MNTAVDSHADAGHGHDADHAHSDKRYWGIALALAIITGMEVGLTYMHIGKLFLPVLLILMVIKFLTVVFEFMHLRLDNKMFKYLFYSGLLLAIAVYVAALATFKFFVN